LENGGRVAVTKLLLVEDNDINLDMIQRRLRKKFDIVVAKNGMDAVALAKSESPQIILMDLGLPDIDGLEATRRIKADPATARIPVIALTAQAMAGDRENTMAAGCDEYEPKPIEDLPRLLGKIEALIARSQHDAAEPPAG
jgi:two-component system, cell cycle response regulator DivK